MSDTQQEISRIIRLSKAINRRRVLKGFFAGVFGSVAGVTLGQTSAVAAFPCSGLPNCRNTSNSFCGATNCNTAGGPNFSCQKYNTGCSSAGNYCWTSGGGKCCDCTCSWFGGGSGTIHCICYV